MSSKLSVDCIFNLIDQLRLDDEKLFYDMIIKNRLHIYKVYFEFSLSNIGFILYARNEEEVFDKFLSKINLRDTKPYLSGYYWKYCHVCMTEETYMFQTHSHNDIEYDEEYLKSYIRSKAIISKIEF